jgi:hypothetical protein
MNQKTWDDHYRAYRESMQEGLSAPTPAGIVVSPDNDDLPLEEWQDTVRIGSYDENE